MKVLQLIKRFFVEKFEFKDVPALVACFALSCFLYYVYYTQTFREKTFTVPLSVRAENGIVPAGPYREDVQIEVKGLPDDVNQLSERDFSAYLNLDYAGKSGKIDVPVLLRLSDTAGRISSLQTRCIPGHIQLDVEKEVTQSVNVEGQIVGTPEKGYEIGEISVSPNKTQITGPHSRVDSLEFLKTVPVNVDGAKSEINLDVPLEDSYFLKVSAETFNVNVKIEPVKITRKIDLVRVRTFGVDDKLLISSQTDNISLNVYGNQSELENWRVPNNLVSADCSKIHSAGRFDVPIVVSLPKQFALTGEVIKTVSVTFKEKPQPKISPEEPKNEESE